MQKAIAKEELYKAAERALVTAVAQVGDTSVCITLLQSRQNRIKSRQVSKQKKVTLVLCFVAVPFMGSGTWHTHTTLTYEHHQERPSRFTLQLSND